VLSQPPVFGRRFSMNLRPACAYQRTHRPAFRIPRLPPVDAQHVAGDNHRLRAEEQRQRGAQPSVIGITDACARRRERGLDQRQAPVLAARQRVVCGIAADAVCKHQPQLRLVAPGHVVHEGLRTVDARFGIGGGIMCEQRGRIGHRLVDRHFDQQCIDIRKMTIGSRARHQGFGSHLLHRRPAPRFQQPASSLQQILAGAQFTVAAAAWHHCCSWRMTAATSSQTCSLAICPDSVNSTTCSNLNSSGRPRPSNPNGRPGALPCHSDSSTRKPLP
jgi:hypothetical protein